MHFRNLRKTDKFYANKLCYEQLYYFNGFYRLKKKKKTFIEIFTSYTTSLNETKTSNKTKLKFTLKFP